MSDVKDITNADIQIGNYLRNGNTAYSRKSLTEKLVSEEYSEETASYAVEKADIDWELMAVKTALSLIDFYYHRGEYTYSDVVEYLLGEGFTREEALIGASSVRARLRAVEDRETSNSIIFVVFGIVFVIMFVAAFI